MRRRRNTSKKYILILAILAISIGYALISTTLNVGGMLSVKSGTYNIHWDDESIVDSGNVTITSHATVTDTKKTIIAFNVSLGKPGDYYEFTADAVNDGSVDGIVKDVRINLYLSDGETPIGDLSNYIKSSCTHLDGSTIQPREVLMVGEAETYKFRVYFDEDVDDLPEDPPSSIVSEVEIEFGPIELDEYRVLFDGNGGTPSEHSRLIGKGSKVGVLPTAVKEGEAFAGWYTEIIGGTKVTKDTIPSANITYYAHWNDSYTMFNTGTIVNTMMKSLAGDDISGNTPWMNANQNITGFVRSNNAPADGVTTSIISAEGQTPIYAWFDNGTIYYYTEANTIYLNQDASNMFNGLNSLVNAELDFETSQTTNMTAMFKNCASITSLDVEDWDVSNVQYLSSMFQECINIESLDLSGWDVSNVIYFTDMFRSNSSLETLDISGWEFSSCTYLANLFYGCIGLTSINLDNVDTSTITDMAGMFTGCVSLPSVDLSDFNTSNVTTLASMFNGCSSLTSLDLSSFDTSKVTDMNGMFNGCTGIATLKLNNWDFRNYNVNSLMSQMSVTNCTSLRTLELNNTKFGSNMYYAFGGLGQVQYMTFENADVSAVTSTSSTFNGCASLLTLDLTSWDTSNITNMYQMFAGCSQLTTITVSDSFVVNQVTSSTSMFGGCTNLVGGRGTVYDSTHIDKEYARYDKGTRQPGYFNKASDPQYTVTLNPNEGEVSPSSVSVYEGEEVGVLPLPTREGYGFAGWYTELEDGTLVEQSTIINNNVTFYAHWVEDKVITYDSNGGLFDNNQTENSISYKYNKFKPTVYSHTDNIDDSGVAGGVYANGISRNRVITIPGADRLKIEVWFSTENNYDWLAIYPSGVTPTESNYNEATISNGRLMGGNSNSKPSDSDATYHRVFYVTGDTVQLYFRSDSSSTYYGYYAIVTSDDKEYKASVPYQKPKKTSSKFLGWNEKSDGSGTSYLNEEDVFTAMSNLPSNKTLYAIWEDEVTHNITYNANNGEFSDSSTTNTITYNYGEGTTTVYSHSPNINDDGVRYRQYGNNLSINDIVTIPESSQLNINLWFLTDNDYSDWLGIYPKGITPNTDNYSQATISNGRLGGHGSYTTTDLPNRSDENFHRQYTVNDDTAQFFFTTGGGSSTYYGYYAIITGTSEGFHGDTYKMPTREGYVFTGWNTKADGSGVSYTNEVDISDGMSNLDVNDTLYAQWYKLQEYTITFDANGGSVDPGSRVVIEGNTIGELPTPTWTDHRFDGWYTDASGGSSVSASEIPKESKRIYAHWTKIHTVTLNANGGSVDPTEIKVINGNTVGTLPTPTKASNSFDGWYTGITDGTKITSTYRPTGDIEIFAHWIPDVAVTFDGNEGVFSGNVDTNVASYTYSDATTTRYSHTHNINDSGVASGTYNNGLSVNDVVTIPGVSQLNIEVWYSTEAESYDWLAIYPKGVTPTASNYSRATISSGKLGGGRGTTKSVATRRTFTVNDDTAQFYFKSDGSQAFYGYYAIITATVKGYQTSDTYLEPTRNGYIFGGWNTEEDGTGTTYANEEEVKDSLAGRSTNTLTLYAKWTKVEATFDTGQNVNTKFKKLSKTYGTFHDIDTYIKSIVKSPTAPNINNMTNDNIVSASTSTVPIYAWFDNGTIYWWTNTDDVYLNEDSSYMFYNCEGLTSLDTSGFNTSRVTDMSFMFGSCYELASLDVSNFSTSNVVNMESTFHGCFALTTLDVSLWDTGNVESLWNTFNGCVNLVTLDVSRWNTKNVTKMNGTFYMYLTEPGKIENLDVSRWDTSKVTDMSYMFTYCVKLTNLDVSRWDTSNVTNMTYMFDNCYKLENLDVSGWKTGKVRDMSYMFAGCYKVQNLDVSRWDTSSATNMNTMFGYCNTLTTLDLSSWDTSNVLEMDSMFGHCQNLTTIYATDAFVTTNVTDGLMMFYDSTNLVGGNGTVYNSANSGRDYARIDRASTPGYFTLKNKWVLVNRGTIGDPTTHLLDQKWSYYENGVRKENGFYMLDDLYDVQQKYYFVNGIAQLGWIHYGGEYYYLSTEDDDGNGYVNAGAYHSETKVIDGVSYTFDSDGKCTNYTGTSFNTVKFNSNGGVVSPNIMNVNTNSSIGTLPTPTRNGYTFVGWYTDLVDGIEVDSTYVPSTDVMLYAKWQK